MDESKILSLALQAAQDENFPKSCSFYFLAFQNDTSNRCCMDNKIHFLFVFKKWLKMLMTMGRQEEFSKFLYMVFDLSPPLKTDAVLIASEILFQSEYVYEAAKLLLSCFDENSINYELKENLEQLYNVLVDRWHFRMLNDKKRNLAYYCALCKAYKSGLKTIIDIGSGTGILSMLASKAGFKSILSCDVSEVMCDLQSKVLSLNKFDNIKLINKMSTSLEIPKDVENRVDLIVTEVFDCGLLGEKVLPTVLHAWKNLLVPRKSKVIPGCAVLMGLVVECGELRKHSFFKSVNSTLVYGTRESDEEQDQLYTTENMATIKNGYRELTDVFTIQKFDFNNPEELSSLVNKKFQLSIPQICDGRIDAVITFFKLMLDDSISIFTGPEDDSCCWEQAVYDLPRETSSMKGESVVLDFVIQPEQIVIETPINQIDNTFTSNRRLVSRMNDQSYWMNYEEAIKEVIQDKSTNDNSHLKICIICPELSQLPILVASLQTKSKGKCTIYILEPSDLLLLYSGKEMPSIKEMIIAFDRSYITDVEKKNDLHFDVVLTEPVDYNGLIKEQFIEDLTIVKSLCCNKQTQFIPSSIDVKCTLIHSKQLKMEHKVCDDSVTLGLEIADVINQFKVPTHPDIDINTMEHLKVSNVMLCEKIKLDENISNSVEAEGFNFWKKSMSIEISKPCIASPTAILYWFDIFLNNDTNIETSPTVENHWKQACYMLNDSIILHENADVIYIRNKSNIHFQLPSL